MKKSLKYHFVALGSFCAFIVWTLLVKFVDVAPIGPHGSEIGFSRLNKYVHARLGVNMALYNITDWLSIIPLCIVFSFAMLGLYELIKRKSLFKVDRSILCLGGLYFVTLLAFVLFEVLAINYRPILIDGRLEASYPSSTTFLVLSVIPSAIFELNHRIKKRTFCHLTTSIGILFSLFMVIARLVCGVHWFTDIIGGVLISFAFFMEYYALCRK